MSELQRIYALQAYDFDDMELGQHVVRKDPLPEPDPSRVMQEGNIPAQRSRPIYKAVKDAMHVQLEHMDQDTTYLLLVILVLCFAHINLK